MKKPGAIWKDILANLKRKPSTVLYPKERLDIPEMFRGKPMFDSALCIGCQICVRDCPSNAIKIEKIEEKRFGCIFYLDRCIFCGQCSDSCPKKAIKMSKEYELASLNREDLIDNQKETKEKK